MSAQIKATELIKAWESRDYESLGQMMNALQALIGDALKNQDRDTRQACADSIAEIGADSSNRADWNSAIKACINVDAV